jgi:hypothetical protein
MLSFLNGALLVGGLAFAIPLIIHLLNRTQYRTLEWGAMFFLEDLNRVQTRAIEWRSLLLLLIRCAIPICLALCMARPLLSYRLGSAFGANDEPKLIKVLVDNSWSMDQASTARDPSSGSILASAKEISNQLVSNSGARTRWSISPLIEGEEFDEPAFTRDTNQLLQKVESIELTAGDSQLIETLNRSLELLQEQEQARRILLVVSDFQRSMLNRLRPEQKNALRERLLSMPNAPQLAFWPLPEDGERNRDSSNVAIRIDSQTPPLIGAGQTCEVRVLVKNYRSTALQELNLVLLVDDVPMLSRTIEVPAKAELQTPFQLTFPESKRYSIKVRLEIDDSLKVDNEATYEVTSLEEIPVLIVDDQLQAAERSTSDFLQAALGPFKPDPSRPRNPFRIVRQTSERLNKASLNDVQVLVLADFERLSHSFVDALQLWIESGGVLVVFPSDLLDIAWCNQRLSPVLGVTLTSTPTRRGPAEAPMKVRREIFQHPALTFINSLRGSALESLEFRQWLSASPNEDSSPSTAILSLANGDGWWWERQLGSGKVLYSSSTCDDSWNNWPIRPVYLPMIQQLLLQAMPVDRMAGAKVSRQPPLDESDLTLASEAEIQSLAEELGAKSLATADDFARLTAAPQQEIWRWLLVLLLIFLFSEVLLQRSFAKGVA